MVAATATVGVEVGRSHTMGLQVLSRRHVRRDGAGRRDMIGRDEVAEVAEHTGALNGVLARHLTGHAVEIGRAAHVGRVVVPSEGIARLGPQGLPRGVALEHVCGALLVQVGRHELVHKSGHLVGGGHDVGVEHGIALSVRAKGILLQIDVHGAGDGVGDDVGRLHQVVLRHVRRNAALEVAVARQNAGQFDVVGHGMHGLGQRARVANAAHAAETAGIEAQLAQGLSKPRPLEQKLGGAATGSQDGLHPGCRRKPALGGVARHEARGQHHGLVGGRGAARHGGDGNGSVGQLVVLAVNFHMHRRIVEAALGADGAEALAGLGERNAIVGARGARQRRLNRGKIELDHLGIGARRRLGIIPVALGLRVGFNQSHLLGAAAREAQVVQRAVVHREQRAGAAVLRGHVRDAGALSGGKRRHAGAEAFHEAAHHTALAQHLCERQRHVHGRHAFGQVARQLHADDAGHKRRDGLAQRGRLRFDAAHAPAEHTDAVGRGRMGVGAHKRIEVHHGRAIGAGKAGGRLHDHAGELLDVQLVADALSRRHDAHVLEGLLGPLQKVVALAIALELQLHVLIHAAVAPGHIRDDRMVDDQIARHLGINLLRIAAQIGAGLAHDGEIDEHRHTREVLEQHARRRELHFLARLARQASSYDALGHGLGLFGRAPAAQRILQKHGKGVRQLRRPLYLAHRVIGVGPIAHLQRSFKAHVSISLELSYIFDDLSGTALEHALAVLGIEAHTIGQGAFHRPVQLPLGEVDDRQKHILEFQIAVIALDALVNERPYLFRALLGRRTQLAQKAHGGQTQRTAVLVEQGRLGAGDGPVAGPRVEGHYVSQRIKTFPTRLSLRALQCVDEIGRERHEYFRILSSHACNDLRCLLAAAAAPIGKSLHQLLQLRRILQRLLNALLIFRGL